VDATNGRAEWRLRYHSGVAIREVDKAAAEAQQWNAAMDGTLRIRLAAGPGTGKSKTIEKRVVWALQQEANPRRIYVISFTRATSHELQRRISRFCELSGLCRRCNTRPRIDDALPGAYHSPAGRAAKPVPDRSPTRLGQLGAGADPR